MTHVTESVARQVVCRDIGSREQQEVVGHLLDGCQECLERMREAMADHWTQQHRERCAEADFFDSWVDELDGLTAQQQREFVLAKERVPSRGFVDRLAQESYRWMNEDPNRAMVLAELSTAVAKRYAEIARDEQSGFDARANATIQLANVYRRCRSDFARAETLLAEADVLLEQGTGDPYLRADQLRVLGLMCNEQTKCEQAIEAIERVWRIHAAMDDWGAVGRSLVDRGIVLAEADRFQDAIVSLRTALGLVAEIPDSRFPLVASHNLAFWHSENGETETAVELLGVAERWCEQVGMRSDRLRVVWTRARLLSRNEDLEQASAAFAETRNGFVDMGMAFEASHVTLDHAAVLLQMGRFVELKKQCRESYEIFRARKLHSEALAALRFLTEAVEKDRADEKLLAYVYEFVKAAQSNTSMKFTPPRARPSFRRLAHR